jgi:hypothetical protein
MTAVSTAIAWYDGIATTGNTEPIAQIKVNVMSYRLVVLFFTVGSHLVRETKKRPSPQKEDEGRMGC